MALNDVNAVELEALERFVNALLHALSAEVGARLVPSYFGAEDEPGVGKKEGGREWKGEARRQAHSTIKSETTMCTNSRISRGTRVAEALAEDRLRARIAVVR